MRAAPAPARPPSPCTGPPICSTSTANCSPSAAVLIVGPNPAFLGYIGEVLPSLGETGVCCDRRRAVPRCHGDRHRHRRRRRGQGPRRHGRRARAAVARPAGAARPGASRSSTTGDSCCSTPDWCRSPATARARRGCRTTSPAQHFEGHVLNALTEHGRRPHRHGPLRRPNLLDARATSPRSATTSPRTAEVWCGHRPVVAPAHPAAAGRRLPRRPRRHLRGRGRRRRPARPAPGRGPSADVPLLDEAAELLGEDDRVGPARGAERERGAQIAYAQGVLDLSYASRTLRVRGRRRGVEVLSAHDIIDAERFAERHEEDDHRSAAERAAADRTWAFGHIIVDEAQELSPMAWRLLMRRSPTRSMTLVGDPPQTAERGGVGSWDDDPRAVRRGPLGARPAGRQLPHPGRDHGRRGGRGPGAPPGFEPPRSVRSTGVRPWVRAVGDGENPADPAELAAAVEGGRRADARPRAGSP